MTIKKSVSYIARIFALCAALFCTWYIVLATTTQYDPALHMTATAISTILVVTKNDSGIICRLTS